MVRRFLLLSGIAFSLVFGSNGQDVAKDGVVYFPMLKRELILNSNYQDFVYYQIML